MGLVSQLREFMFNSDRNAWLRADVGEIFVRKGIHLVKRPRHQGDADALKRQCLDIANINISEEHRGMGVFTAFLNHAEDFVDQFAGWDGIYIENVLPPRLQHYFRNRDGYEEVPRSMHSGPDIPELKTFFRPKKKAVYLPRG